MEKKSTTSPPKKRNHSESQDEASVVLKKKKMLKLEAEEMDTSEIQDSANSSVLFELADHSLSMPNNHGKTIEVKEERLVDEENVSYNDAEENWFDSKASLSILTALSNTIDEDNPSKKKKKKKKHKELDDNVLEDVSDETLLPKNAEENLVKDANENSIEADEMPVKKKKKKKKKSSKKEHSIEEQPDDEHSKSHGNDSKTELIAKEETDENKKSVEENGEGKKEEEKETDSELSFSDTKLMFQDILEKLATSKNISSKMFWEKYRFHPYNSKNCKIAFEKILSKVQKKRTMFELVNAATKMMTESPSVFSDVTQLKPTTPFKLFSQRQYRKISEKHPEYRGIQILNKISQKWGKLSDQKKIKYIDRALSFRDEYMEMVKNIKKYESSFVPKPILNKVEWQIKDRCAGLPDVPAKNSLLLFIQKSGDLYSDLPNIVRNRKLSADFKLLPDEVRKKYSQQVKEDQAAYNKLLKLYLESLSESEREERIYTLNYKANPTSNKQKKNPRLSENAQPDSLAQKPPLSGYMLFYKEHKNVLGDVPLIQKHLIVSEKWNALSEEERNEYKEKRLSLQDESFNLNDKVQGDTSKCIKQQ